MTDSRQTWLESLDPRVRAEVEAEIADYEDPENAEYVEDDDWAPPKGGGMGLTVDFSSEEITTLSQAFGASLEMFKIMHDALMARAHEELREREESDSDSLTAAD
ncbi:MAG: hypothetical protein OXN86_08730 [Chloroflexota bacterium]|nr:hypothetical protein [Chloroflexota bacterium]